MANLVPFGYSFEDVEALPVPASTQPLPAGQSQMVSITCTPESLEFLVGTFETWFEEWNHVILVSSGISSKICTGYIVLEWEACYIDRLFLQILQSEDSVSDFSVYIRDEEV